MSDGSPRFDLTVVLTEAEAIAWWRAWSRQRSSTGSTWAVIVLGLLAGLLAGLIAAGLGGVDDASGGLVAVLGFFAYLSGVWTVNVLGGLAGRRALRQEMDRLRRERRIAIADDGITVTGETAMGRWSWPGVEAVSQESGLILVWLEASPLPIPRRAVAEPEALLAFLRDRLATMARGA